MISRTVTKIFCPHWQISTQWRGGGGVA